MTNYFVRLLIIVLLFGLAKRATAAEPRYADPPMPKFRIDNEGFHDDADDIRALLTSAGRELWRFFPGYEIEPFVVTRGREGPIVLHRRQKGEIIMRLDTGDTLWAQYSYQFSHEFCHILCKYDEDYQGNQFFEEALCETASLFVLRRMADAWKSDPPYKHWRDYGKSLQSYADDRLTFEKDVEPKEFAAFVRMNQENLLKNAKHADFYRSVAKAMLAKVEAEPGCWESVRWINSKPAEEGETLAEYFAKWQAATPEKHRAFVAGAAGLFQIELKD